jgi:hypothetical protein
MAIKDNTFIEIKNKAVRSSFMFLLQQLQNCYNELKKLTLPAANAVQINGASITIKGGKTEVNFVDTDTNDDDVTIELDNDLFKILDKTGVKDLLSINVDTGAVSAFGNMATDSNGDGNITLSRGTTSDYNAVKHATSNVIKWTTGPRDNGTDDYYIYNDVLADPILFLKSTQSRVGISETDPKAILHVDGTIGTSVVSTAASSVTVNVSNGTYEADASSNNITFNLPSAGSSEGVIWRFIKTDNSGNTVTLSRNGSDTFVGGATTHVLSSQGDSVTIQGNTSGNGWLTF